MKCNSTGRPGKISQSILATLFEYKRKKDEAERRYEELRDRVHSELALGAEVEPGALACRIRPSERRGFTMSNLSDLLGKDEAERLRSQIPATVVRTLVVCKARRSRTKPREVVRRSR